MRLCNFCYKRFIDQSWICPSCHQSPAIIDGYLAFAPSHSRQSDGYEASYFAELSPLEAKHFWFRSRNRLIVWVLQKYFSSFLKTKKVLEIGCGTGFVLSGIESAYPELTLCGSEIFTKGLDFAASRLSDRVSLFQMDARSIPFEQEFDIIGAFDVLEHIQEDQIVLTEMYRAVVPDGGIILTVPQHPWLWSQADNFAHHVRRYRAQELGKKVEKVGFKVVRMTSFVSLLLPLMIVSRFQQRKPSSNYNVLSELKIKGKLNKFLEHVMTLERRFIQAGVSFPLGGSLLVIAKK